MRSAVDYVPCGAWHRKFAVATACVRDSFVSELLRLYLLQFDYLIMYSCCFVLAFVCPLPPGASRRYYEAFNWGQGYEDIDAIRLNFGRYICREWNAVHEGREQLWFFEWYMVVYSLNHQTPNERQFIARELLWSHFCFNERPRLISEEEDAADR